MVSLVIETSTSSIVLVTEARRLWTPIKYAPIGRPAIHRPTIHRYAWPVNALEQAYPEQTQIRVDRRPGEAKWTAGISLADVRTRTILEMEQDSGMVTKAINATAVQLMDRVAHQERLELPAHMWRFWLFL
ncbi:unnamed protein product [Bursaphelenchus xylophilus]|uniref:(pine wood nematode) hypothetical protein n=1 Tax=Bursaphelenchus xylophilus TaxID=6326 RepID=A0A1I7SRX0_BURXY|nr:unnamed protein product [Bursaphelenchus xylophilus]CAG9101759.1 unnamed protein product [Bursaphelenchus xylophilus]